jgi:hypothetical protein
LIFWAQMVSSLEVLTNDKRNPNNGVGIPVNPGHQ